MTKVKTSNNYFLYNIYKDGKIENSILAKGVIFDDEMFGFVTPEGAGDYEEFSKSSGYSWKKDDNETRKFLECFSLAYIRGHYEDSHGKFAEFMGTSRDEGKGVLYSVLYRGSKSHYKAANKEDKSNVK